MQYADSIAQVNVIKTGTLLDKLTGIGGLPRGRIAEIYGDPSVGKSTVSFQAIANAQQSGYRCLFADVEWSYEARYAEALGVDNSKLGIIRSEMAEDVLDELEKEIRSGEWDLIVLDSIGGLLPRQEAEKDSGSKTIGGQASLVARFCRKVVPLLATKDVAMLVLNHSFTDLMTGAIKTSGGAKLDFHKSISIRLKKKMNAVLKSGDKKVGKVIIGEVKKNKLAATEGLEVEGQLLFGNGFSAKLDLLADAIDAGIITRDGANFYFGGEKIAYGEPKMRKLMETDFSEKVREAIAA